MVSSLGKETSTAANSWGVRFKRGWDTLWNMFDLTRRSMAFPNLYAFGNDTYIGYGDGIADRVSNTVSAAALSATNMQLAHGLEEMASAPWHNQVFKGSVPQVLIYNRAVKRSRSDANC